MVNVVVQSLLHVSIGQIFQKVVLSSKISIINLIKLGVHSLFLFQNLPCFLNLHVHVYGLHFGTLFSFNCFRKAKTKGCLYPFICQFSPKPYHFPIIYLIKTHQLFVCLFVLGGCYFVFPGASHNRFEHCIGYVCKFFKVQQCPYIVLG